MRRTRLTRAHRLPLQVASAADARGVQRRPHLAACQVLPPPPILPRPTHTRTHKHTHTNTHTHEHVHRLALPWLHVRTRPSQV